MRLSLLAVIGILVFLTLPFVYAEPLSPTSLQDLGSSRRIFPSSGVANASAQGGNVSRLEIDAISITNAWQGYFGNITGNVRLEDANNDTFYAWGNSSVSGEVYASRNSTIDWVNINCTNSTQRLLEETYLGKVIGDGDSVTNTFNDTNHPGFFVGLVNITQNSCYSMNVFVNGANQTSQFYNIMLSDDEDRQVYTTIIEEDTVGFNGEVMDFQLMVAENEQPGNLGPTTYYFFTEIA